MKLLNYVTLPVITVVCSISSISSALAADDLPDWARGLDSKMQRYVRENGLSQSDVDAIQQVQAADANFAAAELVEKEELTRLVLAQEKRIQNEEKLTSAFFLAQEERELKEEHDDPAILAEDATLAFLAQEAKERKTREQEEERLTLAFLAQEAKERADRLSLEEDASRAYVAQIREAEAAYRVEPAVIARPVAEPVVAPVVEPVVEPVVAPVAAPVIAPVAAPVIAEDDRQPTDGEYLAGCNIAKDIAVYKDLNSPESRSSVAGLLAARMGISKSLAEKIINKMIDGDDD